MRGDGRAAYRQVLRRGEFRAVLGARFISMLGDQVARIALSLLVFDRTRSAALAAATFALSLLPALAGPLLAGLADRHPRRTVMIAADTARAALTVLTAVPGMPLPAIFVLLVAIELVGAPANAAQGATVAEVLTGDQLVVGQSVRSVLDQVAQIGGYAAGGLLTVLLTAPGALGLDAATFAASALLVRVGVAHRPAPGRDPGPGDAAVPAAGLVMELAASVRRAVWLIRADARLRVLLGLIWMIGLPVSAEGLAVPYAATGRLGPSAAGWLLAATPLGAVVGALTLSRCPPAIRRRLMGPLAATAGLPLAVCVVRPGLAMSCLLFGLSGMAAAYLTVASALFVQRVPDSGRGQAIGLMSSGAVASQGMVTAVAGLVANRLGVAAVIGLAGTATLVAGVALSVAWFRASSGPEVPGAAKPTGTRMRR
jgi:predicted MFS family arabinose efflux permease